MCKRERESERKEHNEEEEEEEEEEEGVLRGTLNQQVVKNSG